MLNQTISLDTPNVISSPESEDGATLSDFTDGQTLAQFGLCLAPANLSARQAKAAGLLMSGTYGPQPIGSSQQDDLSRLWGSRLQAQMVSSGSTLFRMTWKERRTPAGRLISALRASVRRTLGNVCIGVPTPMAGSPATENYNEAGNSDFSRKITSSRGFWADCDRWYGTDGKYRPIESGLFPLANGISNRMGKLRGYGNAIVPQLAAEFIEATEEK